MIEVIKDEQFIQKVVHITNGTAIFGVLLIGKMMVNTYKIIFNLVVKTYMHKIIISEMG